MKVERLEIPDVLLISPLTFRDHRGHFLETWRAAEYSRFGIGPFVQDNVSVSGRGVLRGLHLQYPHEQAKLVYALRGRAFDVAVDVRVGSPTFRRWIGIELSDENGWQLYVPRGFAHGFLTLTDDVVFAYKCTDYYAPETELVVRWNDPTIAIQWPTTEPTLARRDADAPFLTDLSDKLPSYTTTEI